MDDLDGDGKLLKSPINGQRASRDIVQFVPFRKFIGLSSGSNDFGMSNSRLGLFSKKINASHRSKLPSYDLIGMIF